MCDAVTSQAGQIYQLIPRVMADISAIGKDKTNKQQGFKFRGIDDVMNALKPVMTRHQIFTVPQVLEQTREKKPTNNGGQLLYSLLKIRFSFYAPDGSHVDAVTIGEGMDSGDKASNKAMAIAYKYALFQVFCIPTEDMDDPDAESPQPAADPPPKPASDPLKDFMARHDMTKEQFARCRQVLIDGGVIDSKPSKDMTAADWQALFRAMEINFFEEEGA